ncbi:uncharacterized protein LOC126616299 isoform X2 [Malus sylvestris]|uniref:uncharacterized protein LOC126616299 isoform X2 n=1 Tax=Malus sylvestris TaxID=3752 RepID=UPI0021AC5572|nr:uncharacterized protein LOC126616299 isoform X2 [Malus sylvestris]
MIFPRPFRDPTKRGIVRACDDHCDIAAAKRLEHLAGFPWVQILMNVFSDSQGGCMALRLSSRFEEFKFASWFVAICSHHDLV